MTIQSYDYEKVIYDLYSLLCSHGHMIAVGMLGSQFIFMTGCDLLNAHLGTLDLLNDHVTHLMIIN